MSPLDRLRDLAESDLDAAEAVAQAALEIARQAPVTHDLTPIEAAIVRRLIAARGGVVSWDALVEAARDAGSTAGTRNTVDICVCRIRKRPTFARLIVTRPGHGLCWTGPLEVAV